jgi:hypothetical protein
MAAKDRAYAIDILERLIQDSSQTHWFVGDKAGDIFAAGVVSAPQAASVQQRFYRFFQFVRYDSTHSARVVVSSASTVSS